MDSIKTRYLGQTNHSPSRIIAIAGNGKSAFSSFSHERTSLENHWLAARKIVLALGLDKRFPFWQWGVDTKGYIFIPLRSQRLFVGSELGLGPKISNPLALYRLECGIVSLPYVRKALEGLGAGYNNISEGTSHLYFYSQLKPVELLEQINSTVGSRFTPDQLMELP